MPPSDRFWEQSHRRVSFFNSILRIPLCPTPRASKGRNRAPHFCVLPLPVDHSANPETLSQPLAFPLQPHLQRLLPPHLRRLHPSRESIGLSVWTGWIVPTVRSIEESSGLSAPLAQLLAGLMTSIECQCPHFSSLRKKKAFTNTRG